MRPETADLLRRAAESLGKARVILAAGVPDVAAREAYMAAFHAAQALLFERQGRAPKTHAGVRGVFGRLARDEPGLGPDAGRFLARAYDYKDIADYRIDGTVDADTAAGAIDAAADLVARVGAMLGAPPDTGAG